MATVRSAGHGILSEERREQREHVVELLTARASRRCTASSPGAPVEGFLREYAA